MYSSKVTGTLYWYIEGFKYSKGVKLSFIILIAGDNISIKHSDHGTKRQFRRIQIIIL